MAELLQSSRRNPVLRFRKGGSPQGISGGGKSGENIKVNRLQEQRSVLSRQLLVLAGKARQRLQFEGRLALVVSIFNDSLAQSYAPSDLFHH